jgi:hypothetical protein
MKPKPMFLVLALGLESNNCKIACRNRTFKWSVVVFSVGIAKGLSLESDSMKRADKEVASEKAYSIVSL